MKNKTSKKKEEIKTAQAYNCGWSKLQYGSVNCPECGHFNYVEEENNIPRNKICDGCKKQFNIEWE